MIVTPVPHVVRPAAITNAVVNVAGGVAVRSAVVNGHRLLKSVINFMTGSGFGFGFYDSFDEYHRHVEGRVEVD